MHHNKISRWITCCKVLPTASPFEYKQMSLLLDCTALCIQGCHDGFNAQLAGLLSKVTLLLRSSDLEHTPSSVPSTEFCWTLRLCLFLCLAYREALVSSRFCDLVYFQSFRHFVLLRGRAYCQSDSSTISCKVGTVCLLLCYNSPIPLPNKLLSGIVVIILPDNFVYISASASDNLKGWQPLTAIFFLRSSTPCMTFKTMHTLKP